MSKATAQPLQFTVQVEQSFDIRPIEEHSHTQPLQFALGTGYLNFDISPARKLSDE